MESSQSLETLLGHIVHRLELGEECSNVGRRKTSAKDLQNRDSKRWRVCGFVFIPFEEGGHSKEFLLSLPQCLMRLACDLSLSKHPVRLTRYSYIHSLEASHSGIMPLLEVHSGGLEVERFDRSGKLQRTTKPPQSDLWTLRQFRRYEVACAADMNAERKKSYCIKATVDAISPVISMDPSDPFALVELYDSEHPNESCVLVLRNEKDLVYYYGINPGNTIVIHDVRRREWPVPDIFKSDKKGRFESLCDRTPSHVFATDANSWLQLPNNESVPPIPATTVPLVSVEGEICRVETQSIPTKPINLLSIQCVYVRGDKVQSPTVKLFLTHFPMDTALQLSLQVGARIRAVNIHKLCDESHLSPDHATFGACLRSTVSIITTASESRRHMHHGTADRVPYLVFDSEISPSSSHLQTQPHDWNVRPTKLIYYPVPFQLKRIEESYHECIYKVHVEEWLFESFHSGAASQMQAVPLACDLVEAARKSSHILQGQAHRSTMRNPYAEFFDHGDENIGPNELHDIHCGCSLSRHDNPESFKSIFLGLKTIKTICVDSIAMKFDESLRNGGMQGQSGVWSGSVHLEADDILPGSKGSQIHAGGHITESHSDGSRPASISDSWCQLPLISSERYTVSKGGFVTIRIEKVIVASLCFRTPKVACFDERNSVQKALSPAKTAYFNDHTIEGACTLLRRHGFLLIVSVYLVTNDLLSLNPTDKKKDQDSAPHEARFETIDSLLSNPLLFDNCKGDDWTSGVLLRHRFSPAKISPLGYSQCCRLTICSVAKDSNSQKQQLNGLSHLQSIDVKLSVPCSKSIIGRFREAFSFISGGVLLAEDECGLGACWWTLADSGRTCALTSGGWNELQTNSPARLKSELGVRLRIPLSAMQLSARGYVRCSTHSTQIQADFVPVVDKESSSLGRLAEECCDVETTSGFHFLGGHRVFDGVLQLRPPRRLAFGPQSSRPIGALLHAPRMPIVQLSTLFSLLCRSLRDRDTNHIPLAPSFVRRICHASFLGVAFCQVQCVCSKCFSPLVANKQKYQCHKKRKTNNDASEPSFWHLPHPNQCFDVLETGDKVNSPVQKAPIPLIKTPRHIQDSALQCPNGHSSESYEVSWECSGLVDDGTGQCKLYAERDVAMTLLGMDASTIDSIEEGLWSIPSGTIQFQKSLPPPEGLRARVMHAYLQNRYRKCKNPLSLLEPDARAEYLLHHHCRSSPKPRRPLEYMVRCKPLSDQIAHLNHTMVESSIEARKVNGSQDYALATQEMATYSLPQLKLVLVDCAVPDSDDRHIPSDKN